MPKFNITTNLNITLPNNLQSVVNNINSQLKGVNVGVNININPNATRNLANIQNTLNKTAKTAAEAGDAFEQFGRATGESIKRFAGISIATAVFYKFVSEIKRSVGEAIDFQNELVKIAQVSGTSLSGLKGLTDEVTRLSTSLGVSSKKVLDVAQILAQAGLSISDTKTALQALAKTELAATFTDIRNTVEGAVAAMSQFSVSAEGLEGVLDSVNSVSGRFAVESSDLVTAIRRTGGAFKLAGGNINELLALFTSVRSTTRESAESIATGFRTIFTRLQRNRTIEYLDTLGVKLRDMEGNFIGPYQAVARLSDALSQLSGTDPRVNSIIEELGGFRQVEKVIPLIQQFAKAQQALTVAQLSTGSLTEDAAVAQESFAVQLRKVHEEFESLIRAFGDNNQIKEFLSLLINIARTALQVAKSLEPLVGVIGAVGLLKFGTKVPSLARGIGSKLGFAGGGYVPGQGNRDTVPAMLTPGEFVITKDATQILGRDRLEGINSNAQRFAMGGSVQRPVGGTNSLAAAPLKDPLKRGVQHFMAGGKVSLKEALGLSGQGSPLVGPEDKEGFEAYLTKKYPDSLDKNGKLVPGGLTQYLMKELPTTKTDVFRRPVENSILKLDKEFSMLVPVLTKRRNVYGGALKQIAEAGGDNKANITLSGTEKTEQLDGVIGIFQKKLRDNNGKVLPIPDGAALLTPKFTVFGLDPKVNEFYDNEILPDTVTKINNLRKDIGGDELTPSQIFDNSALGSLRGIYLEGLIRGITKNIGDKKNVGESPVFDILTSNSSIPDLFGADVKFPAEIKNSDDTTKYDSTIAKAVKTYPNDIVKVSSGPNKLTQEEILTMIRDKKKAPAGKSLSGYNLDTNTKEIETDFSKDNELAIVKQEYANYIKSLNARTKEYEAKKPPVKKASGGFISGTGNTDTVPAMLTPGEFVLNTRATKSIGLGNLNRMNNVKGYNKGGVVQHFGGGGIVQHFADGGGVGGLGTIAGIALLVPVINTAAQTFGKSVGLASDTITQFSQTIGVAGAQFLAFRGLNSQVNSLATSMAKAKSAVELSTAAENKDTAQQKLNTSREAKPFQDRREARKTAFESDKELKTTTSKRNRFLASAVDADSASLTHARIKDFNGNDRTVNVGNYQSAFNRKSVSTGAAGLIRQRSLLQTQLNNLQQATALPQNQSQTQQAVFKTFIAAKQHDIDLINKPRGNPNRGVILDKYEQHQNYLSQLKPNLGIVTSPAGKNLVVNPTSYKASLNKVLQGTPAVPAIGNTPAQAATEGLNSLFKRQSAENVIAQVNYRKTTKDASALSIGVEQDRADVAARRDQEIRAKRRAANLEKGIKAASGVAAGLATFSTAAVVGGGIFENKSKAQLESGDIPGARFNAKVGGGLSGAGIGGSIGSVLGGAVGGAVGFFGGAGVGSVPGAAIGSAAGGAIGTSVGAVFGAKGAIAQLDADIRASKLDKTFTDLSSRFKAVANSPALVALQTSSIATDLNNITSQLATTKPGAERSDARNKIKQQLVEVDAFLSSLANSSDNLEDFKRSGDVAIKFFDRFSDLTTAQVIEKYEVQVGSTKRAKQASTLITNAQASQFNKVQDTSNLTTAFRDAFAKYNPQGETTPSASSYFKRDTVNFNKLNQGFDLINSTAGYDVTRSQRQEIQSVESLKPILSDVLLRAVSENPLGVGEQGNIIGSVRQQLSGVSPDILNQIESKLTELKGTDFKEANLRGEIIKNPAKIASEIFETAKLTKDQMGELVSIIEEANTRLDAALKAQGDLYLSAVDSTNNAVSTRESTARFLNKEAQSQGRIGVEDFSSFRREKLQNLDILGNVASVGDVESPLDVANRISQINAIRPQLERQARDSGDVNVTQNTQRAIAQLDTEKTALVKALEVLSDSALSTADNLAKYDRLLGERQSRKDVALGIARGGFAEANKFQRGLDSAQRLIDTGDLGSVGAIGSDQVNNLLDTLGQLKETQKIGGVEVGAIKERVAAEAARQSGINLDLAPTAEEQRTKNEVVNAQANAALSQTLTAALKIDESQAISNTIAQNTQDTSAALFQLLAHFSTERANALNTAKQAKQLEKDQKQQQLATVDFAAQQRGLQVNPELLIKNAGAIQEVGKRALELRQFGANEEKFAEVADKNFASGWAHDRNSSRFSIASAFGNLPETDSNDISADRVEAHLQNLTREFGVVAGDRLRNNVQGTMDDNGNFRVSDIDAQVQATLLAYRNEQRAAAPAVGQDVRALTIGLGLEGNKENESRVYNLFDSVFSKWLLNQASQLGEAGAIRRASGGPVPGAGFSDTVPAMLTPGEFVINQKAAQSIGYGKLAHMNRTGYATGGPVNNNGVNFGNNVKNSVMDISSTFSQVFNSFNDSVSSFVNSMNMFPSEINMSVVHKVEVIFNGAEVFAQMQDSIGNLAMQTVNNEINKMLANKFPTVGKYKGTYS